MIGMTRAYQLKRRAVRQDETRRRIVEAAIQLHQTIGPTATTITQIADRAGVGRVTVYRHFPDELTLAQACSGQYLEHNPPPDPERWRTITEPEERLRSALRETYAYHRATQQMFSHVLADARDHPVMAPYHAHWQHATDILTAYPAVDASKVHLIPNGIDTVLYAPVPDRDVLAEYGLNTGTPIVLFVGRITRQKGVAHLVAAAKDFAPDVQVALCAGAPDTPELAVEITGAVTALQASRPGVVWIQEMLPREKLMQLLTAAEVFICPSIYEPQGIVNLEAMACETAVVGSRVGGIPDVVVEGETGLLVDYTTDPRDFEAGLASAVNELIADPDRAKAMGLAGRQRAISEYGWDAIAVRTVELYRSLH